MGLRAGPGSIAGHQHDVERRTEHGDKRREPEWLRGWGCELTIELDRPLLQ
jgi:hypothetical protein